MTRYKHNNNLRKSIKKTIKHIFCEIDICINLISTIQPWKNFNTGVGEKNEEKQRKAYILYIVTIQNDHEVHKLASDTNQYDEKPLANIYTQYNEINSTGHLHEYKALPNCVYIVMSLLCQRLLISTAAMTTQSRQISGVLMVNGCDERDARVQWQELIPVNLKQFFEPCVSESVYNYQTVIAWCAIRQHYVHVRAVKLAICIHSIYIRS